MKILVADDSKTTLAILTLSLKKLGHEVIPVNNGLEAIDSFQKQHPDLIILDVLMEIMDGFSCAKKIREISAEDWIPIIFLSGSVDDESIVKGIDAGGDDYLTKPYSEITLAAKIKAMQRIADMRNKLFAAQQELSILSSTDTLTGLNNRSKFDQTLRERISHTVHHNCIFSLLFIDLDEFKQVNDNLGHHIGDMLLAEVAKRIKNHLRKDDFIARLGGDEFAIIIDEIKQKNSVGHMAQEIIHLLNMPYLLSGKKVQISASIGISFCSFMDKNKNNVLKNADTAMYMAKKSGKNNYQYFYDDILIRNEGN